jgi:hypothetical protein
MHVARDSAMQQALSLELISHVHCGQVHCGQVHCGQVHCGPDHAARRGSPCSRACRWDISS